MVEVALSRGKEYSVCHPKLHTPVLHIIFDNLQNKARFFNLLFVKMAHSFLTNEITIWFNISIYERGGIPIPKQAKRSQHLENAEGAEYLFQLAISTPEVSFLFS